MSETLTASQIAELQKVAEQAKVYREQAQVPRKNAPELDQHSVIQIGGLSFRLLKQDTRSAMLIVDEELPYDERFSVHQLGNLIVGNMKEIAIKGWIFRPTRFKRGKLTIKPQHPIKEVV